MHTASERSACKYPLSFTDCIDSACEISLQERLTRNTASIRADLTSETHISKATVVGSLVSILSTVSLVDSRGALGLVSQHWAWTSNNAENWQNSKYRLASHSYVLPGVRLNLVSTCAGNDEMHTKADRAGAMNALAKHKTSGESLPQHLL